LVRPSENSWVFLYLHRLGLCSPVLLREIRLPASLTWRLRSRLAPISNPRFRLLRNQPPWPAPGMTSLPQPEIQAWLPSPLRRSARSVELTLSDAWPEVFQEALPRAMGLGDDCQSLRFPWDEPRKPLPAQAADDTNTRQALPTLGLEYAASATLNATNRA